MFVPHEDNPWKPKYSIFYHKGNTKVSFTESTYKLGIYNSVSKLEQGMQVRVQFFHRLNYKVKDTSEMTHN